MLLRQLTSACASVTNPMMNAMNPLTISSVAPLQKQTMALELHRTSIWVIPISGPCAVISPMIFLEKAGSSPRHLPPLAVGCRTSAPAVSKFPLLFYSALAEGFTNGLQFGQTLVVYFTPFGAAWQPHRYMRISFSRSGAGSRRVRQSWPLALLCNYPQDWELFPHSWQLGY